MLRSSQKLLSFVIPCYNEAGNVEPLYSSLLVQLKLKPLNLYKYEIIYVNDGSTDQTLTVLQTLAGQDKHVKIISFSRNFGKEIATTAGIRQAAGQGVIILDADGQHPVNAISTFIRKWESGAQVVVGVRNNKHARLYKNLPSKLFYKVFNTQSGLQLIPGSTDFRLIDRAVQQEFIKLEEHSRMTRALIDWLGFKREYVRFDMAERTAGSANYSFNKLLGLGFNSVVSLSLKPLYFLTYAGLSALLLAVVLAVFSAAEMLIGDPLSLNISGSAYLVMLILFLVGVILISQGVLALYISHIHTETKNRPLYIIDTAASRRLPAGKTGR